MRDPIDIYLDEVLRHASLAPDDERRVRGELKDHLEELTAAGRDNSFTPEEVLAMLNSEFGKPKVVGSAIAGARGRLGTWLKKQKRRLPIALAIGLTVAFTFRWAVAEEFRAATNAIAPAIPQGSRMLIYKLGTTFHSGDAVVFRSPDGTALLGVVKNVSDDGSILEVSRNGEPDQKVTSSRVVGRVVLNTR